jgi:Na+-driven multidrug efflux pump
LPGLLGARVDTAGYTKGYLSIMCAAYPFSMTSIGLTVFLRGAGDPVSVLENGLGSETS